ncbi:hypothetical protein IC617_08410 [Neiella sp. HB171785]|uniref:Uncharacterized protein n=1 Tax=Neiella litorisoli TaxID=2771431 RepID=A0A8J6UPT6_9GAMM|nr:hypothetical protein [Neiella litorisoli]MBD1389447.1 hypothetical protein [Neiella litorisoli]
MPKSKTKGKNGRKRAKVQPQAATKRIPELSERKHVGDAGFFQSFLNDNI